MQLRRAAVAGDEHVQARGGGAGDEAIVAISILARSGRYSPPMNIGWMRPIARRFSSESDDCARNSGISSKRPASIRPLSAALRLPPLTRASRCFSRPRRQKYDDGRKSRSILSTLEVFMHVLLFSGFAGMAGAASWNKSPGPFGVASRRAGRE